MKIIVFILISILLLSRCTVVLPIIGYAAASEKEGYPSLNNLAKLRDGQHIRIWDSLDRVYRGKFLGVKQYPKELYHTKYIKYLLSPNALNLPELYSNIKIVFYDRDTLEQVFCGFDMNSIMCKSSDENGIVLYETEMIKYLGHAESGQVEIPKLRHGLSRLKIPIYSYVELKSSKKSIEFSLYDINKIERITVPKFPMSYLLLGIIIDLLILDRLDLDETFQSMGH